MLLLQILVMSVLLAAPFIAYGIGHGKGSKEERESAFRKAHTRRTEWVCNHERAE